MASRSTGLSHLDETDPLGEVTKYPCKTKRRSLVLDGQAVHWAPRMGPGELSAFFFLAERHAAVVFFTDEYHIRCYMEG